MGVEIAQNWAQSPRLRESAASGLFWIQFPPDKATMSENMMLLGGNDLIEIQFAYKSGQRAILSLAKGDAGAFVFERALAAWGYAPGQGAGLAP